MKKKKYISPRIEWIPLDNYISLQLESTPPLGPYESQHRLTPKTGVDNPFLA